MKELRRDQPSALIRKSASRAVNAAHHRLAGCAGHTSHTVFAQFVLGKETTNHNPHLGR